MGGHGSGRKPRALELVVKGGKSHLTKKQIRERREAEATLTPPADAIKSPTWLDTAARRVWKRVAPVLEDLKVLTNIDLDALAVYCDAVARYSECVKIIKKEKLTVAGPMGGKMQNPAVLAAAKYATIIRQFAERFGLTPAARIKLTLSGNDDDKPQDDFEKRFG